MKPRALLIAFVVAGLGIALLVFYMGDVNAFQKTPPIPAEAEPPKGK